MPDNLHDDQAPSAPHSTLSAIFLGPNGLRAGWSLLIAVVLFFVFLHGANAILHGTHLVPHHAMEYTPGPFPVFFSEGAAFLVIALVTWIMSKIERRPVSVYGLGGARKLRYTLTGAVIGLVAVSLLVLLLDKAGFLVIDQRLLFGSDISRYALLWIPGFFAIGIFEEYLFRGYLQYTITRGLAGITTRVAPTLDPRTVGFWTAAVLVSFGFGALHGSNPGESPLGLFSAGFASLVFCFSLWRTGSLWWAIGLHTAWDYGQSFIYGVADSGSLFDHRFLATHPTGAPLLSGGATGPEGSIFCLIILAVLAAIIHYAQPLGPKSYAEAIPLPPPTPAHDSDIAAAN